MPSKPSPASLDEATQNTSKPDAVYPSTFTLLMGPAGEFLFVLLPLLVLAIVYINNGKSIKAVLASAEWSFGAAVLFGQAIVKLVSGMLRMRSDDWEEPVLIVAVVIVFGLVPSLTVLDQVLTKELPGNGLVVCQIILFVIGSLVFFGLGMISQYGLFYSKEGKKKQQHTKH